MNTIARPLFLAGLAAIPLASFLTFLAQPLTGRNLLPIYGGQAVVWLTVMLFFSNNLTRRLSTSRLFGTRCYQVSSIRRCINNRTRGSTFTNASSGIAQ